MAGWRDGGTQGRRNRGTEGQSKGGREEGMQGGGGEESSSLINSFKGQDKSLVFLPQSACHYTPTFSSKESPSGLKVPGTRSVRTKSQSHIFCFTPDAFFTVFFRKERKEERKENALNTKFFRVPKSSL